MLGRALTLRRTLVVLLPIAAAAVMVPGVRGAGPGGTTGALRSLDARLAARQHSAALDLYSLDNRLERARARLSSLEQESRMLAAERATLTAELGLARRGAVIAQSRLAERVRLLYEQDQVNSLEVMLGSSSFDDALTRLDNLETILARDREIASDVASTSARLHSTERGLAARRAALDTATRNAAATAGALEAARSARAAFISSLAERRRLTQRQIDQVVSRARFAERRSAMLAPVTTTGSTPALAEAAVPDPGAPATAGTSLTVSASAYSLPGFTASGLRVGWGVAAVDPRVIPLGTRFFVPGYGEAVAADVGTAVLGPMIDLWFPTFAQAAAWGRQTVTIVIR